MAHDDQTRYQRLLDATRGSDGVAKKADAVKLFKELLLDRTDRLDELAEAKANEVARAFDKAHQPEIENGQMTLFADSYLSLGDNDRVRAADATATHTRRWLQIQSANHDRVKAAFEAKELAGRRLLAVQDEHGCSLFEAQQLLQAGAA